MLQEPRQLILECHPDDLPRYGRVGEDRYPIIFIGKGVQERSFKSHLEDGFYQETDAEKWQAWYEEFAADIREIKAVAVLDGDWNCRSVHSVTEVTHSFPLGIIIGEKLFPLIEKAEYDE